LQHGYADRETTKSNRLRARTKVKGKPTPEQLKEFIPCLEGAAECAAEAELATAEAERDALSLPIPNLPADDVPDGSTEDDVREVRRIGEPPQLAEVKDHTEIGSL
jgi:seryl-tRNA synthetase